ncbi:MAG: InlB B-repeat-containing protein, partial [Clostridia bacterium]|nr:InlB B-repeat-containing protein [Clostridia bacterium]
MKSGRRFLALVLSFLLVFQMIPSTVLSDESAVYQGIKTYSVYFADEYGKDEEYLIEAGNAIDPLPKAAGAEGMRFLGWYDGDALITAPYTPSSNVKLTAKYELVLSDQTITAGIDGLTVILNGELPENDGVTLKKVQPGKNEPKRGQGKKKTGSEGDSKKNENAYRISLNGKARGKGAYHAKKQSVAVTVKGKKLADAVKKGQSIVITKTPEGGEPETIENITVRADEVSFTVTSFDDITLETVQDLSEKTVSAKAEGVNVQISGELPAHAGMTADAPEGKITVGEEEQLVAAADIKLTNYGIDIQPKDFGDGVTVTLSSTGIAKAVRAARENDTLDNLKLYHIDDNGTRTPVTYTLSGDDMVFTATGFSVYAVVDDGSTEPEARVTVNFIVKDQTISTVYVKNSDAGADLAQIVYDPGLGTVTLEEDELFYGWSIDDPDYTLESTRNTIKDVRTYLQGLNISEGGTVNLYAIIFKTWRIVYVGENDVALGTVAVPVTMGTTQATATLSMSYTPGTNTRNFEGWKEKLGNGAASNIVSASESKTVYDQEENQDVTYYTNGTELTIKGDVVLKAYAPLGVWLIFDQNGEHATYNSPQFVIAGSVTKEPRPWSEMLRLGYEFKGWYTDPECADGTEFIFGQPLTRETIVYARWDVADTAPYTVIIWKKKVGGQGYEYAEMVTGSGNVNSLVPVTAYGMGTNTGYVTINGVDNYRFKYDPNKGAYTFMHNGTLNQAEYDAYFNSYTGFYLKEYDQGVTINPEGTSVVNVYYDRIFYTVKFYYARQHRNSGQWQVSSGTRTDMNVTTGSWYNVNTEPTCDISTKDRERNGDYYYYFYTIDGEFGENITDEWPKYDSFGDAGSYKFTSWWVMHSSGSYRGSGSGRDTIKGIISVMDEKILGNPTSSNANDNILIHRYNSGTRYRYIYHINLEDIEKDDNGDPKYTETRQITAYSSNNNVDSASQPAFPGFEIISSKTTRNPQNLPADGNTDWHWYYYYKRLTKQIVYNDGSYYDGNNNKLEKPTATDFITTNNTIVFNEDEIPFEDDISEYGKGGEKYYTPETGLEYTFAGWYLDEACTQEYQFTTMPADGVQVYAKWIKNQYRVFLHPNKPEDAEDDIRWGSDINLTFRESSGEKVDTPTGLLDEYDLIGWYLDEDCTRVFNDEKFILTDDSVTTPYDKTEYTDPMNDQGEIGENPYNSDLTGYDHDNNPNTPGVDRFWIKTKLDLYAKWSAKLPGALGINVEYDVGDSDSVITDNTLYKDNVGAVVQQASVPHAATPPLVFDCWEVMKWNEDTGEYEPTGDEVYPGGTFTVLKSNAKTEFQGVDTHGEDIFKYTVQLRAKYGPAQEPTPTHIYWYGNGGTLDKEVTSPEDTVYTVTNDSTEEAVKYDKLQINEAIPIVPADTFVREGHKFIGWAKSPDATEPWLVYDEETGEFKENSATRTQVAADESEPYEDLYAVWKSNMVVFHKEVDSAGELNLADVDNHTIYLLLWDRAANDYYKENGQYAVRTIVINDGVPTPASVRWSDVPDGSYDVTECLNANGDYIQTGTLLPDSSNPKYQLLRVDGDNDAIVADGSTADVTLTNVYAKPDVPVNMFGNKHWMNRTAQEYTASNLPSGATATFSLYQVMNGMTTLVAGKNIVLDGTVDNNMPATEAERISAKWFGEYEPWKAGWYGLDTVDPTTGASITYLFRETAATPAGFYPYSTQTQNGNPMPDTEYKQNNGHIWNRDLTGTVVIQKHFDFQPNDGDLSVGYQAFGQDQDCRRILWFELTGPNSYHDTFTLADVDADGNPSVSGNGLQYSWVWNNNTQYKLFLHNMAPGTYTITEHDQEHLLEKYNYYLESVTPTTGSATNTFNIEISTQEPEWDLTNIHNQYRFGAVTQNGLKLKKTVTGLDSAQWNANRNRLQSIDFYITRTIDGVKQYYKQSVNAYELDPDTGRVTKLRWTTDKNSAAILTVNNINYSQSGSNYVTGDMNLNNWPQLEVGEYALEEKDESISGLTWSMTGGTFEIKPQYKTVNGSTLLDKIVCDPEVIPVTNAYELNEVSVTVSKTVVGADNGDEFTITATVTDNETPIATLPEQPDQPEGVSVTDNEDGTLTITLKGGKTATLNLPEGAKLVVEETENALYTTTYEASDTIDAVADGDSITVKNTRDTIQVTVSKTVSGADDGTEFEIVATVTDGDTAIADLPEQPEQTSGVTVTDNGDGTLTIKLNGGESA